LMGRVRKNKLKALLLAVVMLASPVGVALALNSEDLLQRYAQAEAAGDFAEAAAAAELLANGNHDGIKLPPEEQLILKRAAADNHLLAGNKIRAASLLEQVIEETERTTKKSPDLAATYEELADVLLDIGDTGSALQAISQALVIYGNLYGTQHPSYRFPLTRAASFYARAGDGAKASELADAALRLEQKASSPRLYERLATKTRDVVNEAYEIVDVYYGTNRQPSGKGGLDNYYSGKRGDFDLGIVSVSVPRNNRSFGEVNRPDLFKLEFRPDPDRHIMLWDITPLGAPVFYERLRGAINRSDRKEALVYIHGFKNTFDDAARRTAQLAYDLDIDGAPILYSWPSGGTLLSYVKDGNEVNNVRALRDFEDFLQRIVETSGAEKINVIAHSMGNRFLTEALDGIVEKRRSRGDAVAPIFDQVVFAAPDVDRERFADLMGRASGWAGRFTLYTSANDLALELSQRINAYPRAGDAAPPLVMTGLDTIDASAAPADPMGHTYFASGALGDIQAVLWHGLGPDQRCVLQKESTLERLWRFNKNRCDDLAFRTAMFNLRRLGPTEAMTNARQNLDAARADRNTKDIRHWEAVIDQIGEALTRG
ncbi:MAG: alpha/beta hydrolase, partial [Pseudomonadota bacterium]